MKIRKLDKFEKISYALGLLCLILLIPVIIDYREETKLIDQIGIEAVGTVINRWPGSRRSIASVQFKFEYQGEMIISVDSSVGQLGYNKAAIGDKYKVKFLPDRPKKARIYLDQPVFCDDGK
ncbi:MAG: hypothetical protein LBR57_03985 [Alistipes sp.]|jgi:hypothetical protein|nr:hypothetical protein [Alistipes sp.]